MKTILLLLFITVNAAAQDSIVNVNASKETLRSRAQMFFAEKVMSANDAIQLNNESTIIAKGSVRPVYFGTTFGYTYFTVKIDFKDNKYRYTVSDLVHSTGGSLANDKGVGFAKQPWRKLKENSIEKIENYLSLLTAYMATEAKDF